MGQVINMDVWDPKVRGRLSDAMERAYRELSPFRKLIVGLVEEYAGTGYGDKKSRPQILLNLIAQTVEAYTMALAANRPRVLLSTEHIELHPFAEHFQLALNNLIKEIELEKTLRAWVLDAFFCIGILKIHMAEGVEVMLDDGMWVDPGSPNASNIPLDNFVFDITAPEWERIKFSADCYRIPFEHLQDSMFDQDAVRDLRPTSKYAADGDAGERLEQIAMGREVDEDDLEPMIDVCDVWCPDVGIVYTFAMDPTRRFLLLGPPIATLRWTGHEFGPHKVLSFVDVPQNIMPASTAGHLAELARLVNSVMRKGARQARRQRDVNIYTPAGAEDAKSIRRANDADWVQVQSKEEVDVLKLGGVDPSLQAFLHGIMQMYDRMSGNLQAMAGLGAQAPTAAQENIIHRRVGKREASMQFKVLDGTRRVMRDLGWLLWNDKVKHIHGRMPVEGVPEWSIQSDWTPDDRQGQFIDYDFNIDVYSMQYRSPAERVQILNELLGSVYLPAAELLMAQGGTINFERLSKIHAELLHEPRIREIIQFGSILPEEGVESHAGGRGAPVATTRNYVRQNVPTGGTPEHQAQETQQAWLGAAGRGGNQG